MNQTQNTGLGKVDRFHTNPTLRDEEWNRARQPPWWLMVAVLAIVTVAFFVGAYGGATESITGWIVGIVTIAIFRGLDRLRCAQARRHLRQLHAQAAA